MMRKSVVFSFILLILCSFLISGCASFKHGRDTSAYKSLGWIKVDRTDTWQDYSGYKRLLNAVEADHKLKAFIDVNGLPDYLMIPERAQYYLAYFDKSVIYYFWMYSRKQPVKLHYTEFGNLPENIESAFYKSDKSVRTFATLEDAVTHYEMISGDKYFYIAYENSVRYACGIGKTVYAAMSYCQNAKKEAKINAQCKHFASGNVYYLDKSDPNNVIGKKPEVATTLPEREHVALPPPPTPSEGQKALRRGTGFAVRGDGFILTCFHIVDGADTIGVFYTDGNVVPAKLLKYSWNNDLALIKIDRKTSTYLELEDDLPPYFVPHLELEFRY